MTRRTGLRNPSAQDQILHHTTPDDVRLRLREIQRKMSNAAGGTPTSELVTLPGVHALSYAMRYLEGGRDRFVQLVQRAVLNNVSAAHRWYAVYRDLNDYERTRVSFDDVCAASGVGPDDLMSAVVATAMRESQDVGNLVAAVTHPIIVRQAAKSAKRIGGQHAVVAQKDREMLFQHSGFIPVPKSAVINVNATAAASSTAQAAAIAGTPTVPAFSASMAAIDSAKRTVQGRLAAAPVALPAATETDLVEVSIADAVLIDSTN